VSSSRGLTLVELCAVLVLMGIVLILSGMALTSLRSLPQSQRHQELRRASMQAIKSGQQTLLLTTEDTALFLPDGRAIGAGVDPLTGAPCEKC